MEGRSSVTEPHRLVGPVAERLVRRVAAPAQRHAIADLVRAAVRRLHRRCPRVPHSGPSFVTTTAAPNEGSNGSAPSSAAWSSAPDGHRSTIRSRRSRTARSAVSAIICHTVVARLRRIPHASRSSDRPSSPCRRRDTWSHAPSAVPGPFVSVVVPLHALEGCRRRTACSGVSASAEGITPPSGQRFERRPRRPARRFRSSPAASRQRHGSGHSVWTAGLDADRGCRLNHRFGPCRRFAPHPTEPRPSRVRGLYSEHMFDDLNHAQRAAATHGEGPLLIVAGAGTGRPPPSPPGSRT